MIHLTSLLDRLDARRRAGGPPVTLLAVCPNSPAVLEAGVRVAAEQDAPMLFAATLNQVDRDGGYTGWTPASFVAELGSLGLKYGNDLSLYPCLDHGGPWLKDRHTTEHLSLEASMAEVKQSLDSCLAAGYHLLHVDPTVDPRYAGKPLPVELVVQRTIELIWHAESTRSRMGLAPVCYEVGTEEVHGGLADVDAFRRFLELLQTGLDRLGLAGAWPRFVVGKVGTDLHTTFFDPKVATCLVGILAPRGSFLKGHYTDWVDQPALYPLCGVGGANVGPEFTAEEFLALQELCRVEERLRLGEPGIKASGLMERLEEAVVNSGRWRKWLEPVEQGLPFERLEPQRRVWLVQTGARYVWSAPAVRAARGRLYENVRAAVPDAHGHVVERIAAAISRYIRAFGLSGLNRLTVER